MPEQPLYNLVFRQFVSLVSLFGPSPSLDAFLAEDLFPLEKETLLRFARDVAERLILAANEDSAKAELLLDRAKTQAFFALAHRCLPALKETLKQVPSDTTSSSLPFAALAYWIHDLSQMD